MGMRYRRKVPVAQDSENSNSMNKEAVIAPAEAPVAAANVVSVTKHEKLKQQQRRKLVRESNRNQEVDAVEFAKPQHDVVAAGSKVEPVESDNQVEQRREESAVKDVVTVSNQPQEDDASSSMRGGPSYTRKKKHKPVISNQETSTSSTVATIVSAKKKSSEKPRKEAFRAARGKESLSLTPEVIEVVPKPPVVVESPVVEIVVSVKQQQSLEPAVNATAATTAAVLVASPKAKRQKKKKKNKRNVVQDDSAEVAESDKSSEKSDALPTEPIIVPAVAAESARVQEPPPTQIEQQPRPRKESTPELRRRKQFNSKKGNNPSLMKQLLWKVKPIQPKPVTSLEAPAVTEVIQGTELAAQINEEEDEEIAYAVEERHSLKLHASSVTKSISPCVVESSSQETQSGSEDESSFVQYGLSPSEESHGTAYGMGSELDLLDSFFPTPLSLDTMESVKLHSPSVRIHEILLEDFVFSPAELFIVKGDLVVWRVSKQTLGMVEHSLDATLFDTAGNHVRKTSTPLLGPGSGFAWRFDVAGCVDVECSVYKSQCVVHVSEDHDAKKHVTLKPVSATTNSQRRKKKAMAKAKRAAKAVIAAVSQPEADGCEELETRSDSSEPVVVFHPAKDLTRVPEMDAGVCRAVLSQLEEVKAAAEASFIVVGDIPCPVVGEAEGNERVEPESRADDVEDNQVDASEAAETDEVVDFQQRIIAMLQKSEASQMRQRSSFFAEGSGFNAGGAYDFFKRRFAQVQSADEPVVYSLCPERQVSAGVELSDLLNVLVANKV